MKIKNDSILVQGIRPELVLALQIVNDVYKSFNKELVITSIYDGDHSDTSLHYTGCAVDLRIYADLDNEKLRTEIERVLNIDYDVILESNHIHLEYQPRRR